jgi:hypothetical protein
MLELWLDKSVVDRDCGMKFAISDVLPEVQIAVIRIMGGACVFGLALIVVAFSDAHIYLI